MHVDGVSVMGIRLIKRRPGSARHVSAPARGMRSRAHRVSSVVLCALAMAAITTVPASASRQPPRWAPASEATIHPGVQTFTGELQCTANFVFYDSRSVYLGQAAHCSGRFGQEGDGCTVDSLPLGTPVEIEGTGYAGTIVYNSWLTMQRVGERSAAACSGNDFALIRLLDSLESKVNPSLPFWGGPTTSGGRSSFGDRVYSYGNSGLRAGIGELSPKYGINTTPIHHAIGDTTGWGGNYGGWTHYITTLTPGIFGDSGSPVLDARGRGLGNLSTVSLDGSNGIADLSKALKYMKAHTKLDAIQFAKGTESFSPLL